MADTKTTSPTDTTAGGSTLETLLASHDLRPWPGTLGPMHPSGDTAADARTAMAELDAIRAGAGREYGADARASMAADNAAGVKPAKTAAEIDAALAGGRKAPAVREATRGTEAPARTDFNAMVQAEVEKLLGIKPGSTTSK